MAAAAGVAKGTVYLYFASRDELRAGLRARYPARFAAAVEPATSGRRAGVATRLQRFVDGLFAFSTANASLHHLLFHEAGFSEDDAFAGTRSHLEELLAEGTTEGAFEVRDPALAAGFLLHGLHGLLVDAMHAAARDLARRSVTP